MACGGHWPWPIHGDLKDEGSPSAGTVRHERHSASASFFSCSSSPLSGCLPSYSTNKASISAYKASSSGEMFEAPANAMEGAPCAIGVRLLIEGAPLLSDLMVLVRLLPQAGCSVGLPP